MRQAQRWDESGIAAEEELKRLSEALRDWAHDGDLAAYELYDLCRALDWKVLPVSGGWLDQPAWFVEAVKKFSAMERWVRLNDEILADTSGLPSVEGLEG
jgi:hypothetical protein